MDRQALSDVLFVLASAREHEFPALNRTSIQRLLYLAAALYPLANGDWGYGFSNARFGPFNLSVNQAGDRLVLGGLCEFGSFGVNTDGNIRATYRATIQGIAEVERVCKIRAEQQRFEWIDTVLGTLDIYGLAVISKMATKEPSYLNMRSKNQVGIINLEADENDSIALAKRLAEELEKRFGIAMTSVTDKLILYFDFLSSGLLKAA
jgi:hypothetical protein